MQMILVPFSIGLDQRNAAVVPSGSHGDPEWSGGGPARSDVLPEGISVGRDEPDDFADGPDETDGPEEWEPGRLMSLKDLAICIAADLLSGGRFSGGGFAERRRLVDAADPEHPAVHRAYLAAAVAEFGTLDCDALRDQEVEVPEFGRAMEAVRSDRGLVHVSDLSLASTIKPTLMVGDQESEPTKIQWMCYHVSDIRYHDRMALHGDAFDCDYVPHFERKRSYWDALQAIALLYGDEGLREILAMEWVHWAIHECHDTLWWPIGRNPREIKREA